MTTVQERPRLDTPPPPRRGVRLALILAVIVALIAAGVWLLVGGGEPDPEPAPAEPQLTTAERNAQLQAQDVAAATDVVETYSEYFYDILAAWSMDAAPLTEVATQSEVDSLTSLLETAAIEDPVFTGTVTVEVNPDPIAWTPASPRTMTLEVCVDVSQSSFTDGGEGPDVRFLPDDNELIPRYVVTHALVRQGGSWLVSTLTPSADPC